MFNIQKNSQHQQLSKSIKSKNRADSKQKEKCNYSLILKDFNSTSATLGKNTIHSKTNVKASGTCSLTSEQGRGKMIE